jgi:hypothetical protein
MQSAFCGHISLLNRVSWIAVLFVESKEMTDAAAIEEGAASNFSEPFKAEVFAQARRAVDSIGGGDCSEESYTRRSEYIIDVLANRIGGEWFCIFCQQKQRDETPVGFFVPSIRNLSFVMDNRRHFVFVAQIFSPYVPTSGGDR